MWAWVYQDFGGLLYVIHLAFPGYHRQKACGNHETTPKTQKHELLDSTSIVKFRMISSCIFRSLISFKCLRKKTNVKPSHLHELNIIFPNLPSNIHPKLTKGSNFKHLPSDVFLHLHPTILPVAQCHDSFAQHVGVNPTAVASAAIPTQGLLHAPPARGFRICWQGFR